MDMTTYHLKCSINVIKRPKISQNSKSDDCWSQYSQSCMTLILVDYMDSMLLYLLCEQNISPIIQAQSHPSDIAGQRPNRASMPPLFLLLKFSQTKMTLNWSINLFLSIPPNNKCVLEQSDCCANGLQFCNMRRLYRLPKPDYFKSRER